MSEVDRAAERLRRLQPKLTEALNLWREFQDSGWKTHANTPELLDAVNVMAHVCALEHAADDGEKLTREWWQKHPSYKDGSLCFREVTIELGAWGVYVTVAGSDVLLPIKTRGQLRQLLRALGVSE